MPAADPPDHPEPHPCATRDGIEQDERQENQRAELGGVVDLEASATGESRPSRSKAY
jgi:hypothetical protein